MTSTDKYQRIMSKYLGEKKKETKRITDKLKDLFAQSSDDDS